MSRDIYEEILKVYNQGGAACLAMVIETEGSTPRKPGTKMLVRADGSFLGTLGGGPLEQRVIAEARKALETGEPGIFFYDLEEGRPESIGMICGGKVKVFLDPIQTAPVLYLVGSGHVARAVAEIAGNVGFTVTVIDDDPRWANRERFPRAADIRIGDHGEAVASLSPQGRSFLVIMTRDHKTDQAALREALKGDFDYVGMIGSRKKINKIKDNLAAEGISAEKLEEFYAPIGIHIGAETPEEIAVSVAAELISVLRGARAASLSRDSG
jgi:xanthine dehydrogenase accessory factor